MIPCRSALDYLKTIFGDLILQKQNCFESDEGYEELLKAIPDSKVADRLRTKWDANPQRSSESKWSDLLRAASSERVSFPPFPCPLSSLFFLLLLCLFVDIELLLQNLMTALEDIILLYTYPRLDAEVSKHRNHLLKAPFCVHPKTGRVCVPLDVESIDRFDPEGVPTVVQLLKELDAVQHEEGETKEFHSGEQLLSASVLSDWPCATLLQDWEHTSLKPYIDFMDKHASRLLDITRREKRKAGGEFCYSILVFVLPFSLLFLRRNQILILIITFDLNNV